MFTHDYSGNSAAPEHPQTLFFTTATPSQGQAPAPMVASAQLPHAPSGSFISTSPGPIFLMLPQTASSYFAFPHPAQSAPAPQHYYMAQSAGDAGAMNPSSFYIAPSPMPSPISASINNPQLTAWMARQPATLQPYTVQAPPTAYRPGLPPQQQQQQQQLPPPPPQLLQQQQQQQQQQLQQQQMAADTAAFPRPVELYRFKTLPPPLTFEDFRALWRINEAELSSDEDIDDDDDGDASAVRGPARGVAGSTAGISSKDLYAPTLAGSVSRSGALPTSSLTFTDDADARRRRRAPDDDDDADAVVGVGTAATTTAPAAPLYDRKDLNDHDMLDTYFRLLFRWQTQMCAITDRPEVRARLRIAVDETVPSYQFAVGKLTAEERAAATPPGSTAVDEQSPVYMLLVLQKWSTVCAAWCDDVNARCDDAYSDEGGDGDDDGFDDEDDTNTDSHSSRHSHGSRSSGDAGGDTGGQNIPFPPSRSGIAA